MARIFPFQALRYDPARVEISRVVTQPYDKITPAMQDRYYAAEPHNLVRIILGKSEGNDTATENVYTRAASFFRNWRAEGVLKRESEPSLYVYEQRFVAPGEETQEPRVRRGVIGLAQIEDYAAGVIFRHEQTLAKPKADRLNLLRATRGHFGQIFMLYSDPGGAVEAALDGTSTPWEVDVADEYGVCHRVRRVSDPQAIASAQRAMADKKLVIADGHHRYETALNFRNECREKLGRVDPEASHERVMMTFVRMESPGLGVLPTHRVVFGLPGFEAGGIVAAARSFYAVRDVSHDFDPERPTALLRGSAAGETVMLAITARSAFLMRADREARHPALEGLSSRQAELDVVRLHSVVLQSVLGLSEASIREQKNLEYLRDAREAVQRVRSGEANVAFLMNPARIEQVRDVALAGEVMPQKSTDFYPKLLSGLTVYALD